ncbi:hypothetical protein BCT49_12165 [Vibrio lentus]|uniref:Uncharacterized protein n=1 Tax=Vibrio lentus TaxID=136468 RepID=A0A2N7K0F0_9VIBR|nr:hypothetical protein BCT49_12165 [Vibrio lentus]
MLVSRSKNEIPSLTTSKQSFVIPESSRTRYQGSLLAFIFNTMLINLSKQGTLANVALLIEARSHFSLLLKRIRKKAHFLLKLLLKGPLKGLREMICTNVR